MNPEFEIGDVVMFNKNGSFDRHRPSFECVVAGFYVTDSGNYGCEVVTEHDISKYSWASNKQPINGLWSFNSMNRYLTLLSHSADESHPISEIESII